MSNEEYKRLAMQTCLDALYKLADKNDEFAQHTDIIRFNNNESIIELLTDNGLRDITLSFKEVSN